VLGLLIAVLPREEPGQVSLVLQAVTAEEGGPERALRCRPFL
jgi:hypothetical protein